MEVWMILVVGCNSKYFHQSLVGYTISCYRVLHFLRSSLSHIHTDK